MKLAYGLPQPHNLYQFLWIKAWPMHWMFARKNWGATRTSFLPQAPHDLAVARRVSACDWTMLRLTLPARLRDVPGADVRCPLWDNEDMSKKPWSQWRSWKYKINANQRQNLLTRPCCALDDSERLCFSRSRLFLWKLINVAFHKVAVPLVGFPGLNFWGMAHNATTISWVLWCLVKDFNALVVASPGYYSTRPMCLKATWKPW